MKDRFSILDSLEKSYLAVQNKITSIKPGSALRSLLYSISTQLEDLYTSVDDLKNALTINSTGTNLDNFIAGLFGTKISRNAATHSVGYAVFELGEPIALETDLNKLKFSFVYYDAGNNYLNNNYNGAIFTKLTKSDGTIVNFYLTHPLLYNITTKDLEINANTGEQNLVSAYKDAIKNTLKLNPNRPVKYLILPIVSLETGQNSNANTGEINTIVNLGIPTTLGNNYYPIIDTTRFSFVDVDGVLSTSSSSQLVLGDNSFISGGTDAETDEAFRNRYFQFLDSLSRGTLEAIEFAINTSLNNVNVKATESNVPGILNIYIDAPQTISKALITRISGIISEYKSAGILANLRPTKSRYLSILVDLDSQFLDNSTENVKNIVGNYLDTKNIGDTLSYTELSELLNIQDIKKIDNLFYGYYFDNILYNQFYTTIDTAYAAILDDYQYLLPVGTNISIYVANFSGVSAVRVATSSNIALDNTTTVIDGITLLNNDRILVKNQIDGSTNGIYIVNTAGAWSRSTDANTPLLLNVGKTIKVTNGILYGNSVWIMTSGILGQTSMVFEQAETKGFSALYKRLTDTTNAGLTNIKLYAVDSVNVLNTENLNYPLISLVNKALSLPKDDVTLLSSFSKGSALIVKTIQDVCLQTRTAKCLDTIRTKINTGTYNVPYASSYTSNPYYITPYLTSLTINMYNIKEIVGNWYVNYFLTKLLTIPVTDNLSATEATNKIQFFIWNDILNLTYEDLSESNIGVYEKVRLGRNFSINNGIYTNIYMLGTRKVEK